MSMMFPDTSNNIWWFDCFKSKKCKHKTVTGFIKQFVNDRKEEISKNQENELGNGL